jgi:RNA polymerase sigma-70 factor (ECF subfamily)
MRSLIDTGAGAGDRNVVERTLDSENADDAMVAGLRAGNDGSFEELVRVHGGHMMAVARRFMRNEPDAADAVQDALVCVLRKAGQFEGGSRLSTWLHRVTVNACLMRLRSAGRRHEVNVDELYPAFDSTGHHVRRPAAVEEGEQGGPAGAAVTAELRETVRACIDRLPESHRAVLLLRDIEELDTEETARVLGCSPNCVKTRLHRARCALRELLMPVMCGG